MDSIINISLFISVLTLFLYLIYYISNKENIVKLIVLFIFLAFIAFNVYFLYYSFKFRFPISNQYESVLLIIEFIFITTFYYYFKNGKNIKITMPLVFILPLLLSILNIIEPSMKPLMPALRSNWLFFHVLSSMISYSFFALSGIWGLIIFLKNNNEKENYIINMTKLGFAMLTVGIITGAVWAENAWGRYWSWDPKETWSLITWFYYAMILHFRQSYLKDRKFAFSLFIGLLFVIFTYFGVNYLLSGLHSYA